MEFLTPHPKQEKIIKSNARFKVIRAGRKGGKTKMEVELILFKAVASVERLNIKKNKFDTGRKVLYIAPTQEQARGIIWESLKTRIGKVGNFNEQRLQIKVPNEDGDYSIIMVGGWENRENYRGLTDVIHITFDEVDTLKNFFVSWKEIFRPLFLDTSGTADFIGTPKKENPNIKRLEKEIKDGRMSGDCFHFTSIDNPYLPIKELEAIKKDYSGDYETYKQEVLAEHIENKGSLFNSSALVDVFYNIVSDSRQKYLIIDVSGDGKDKMVFSYWKGLTEYKRRILDNLQNEELVEEIRNEAKNKQIPYGNICVDGIGVGERITGSSFLRGIVIYKGSYAPIKTDIDPVRISNINYLPGSQKLISDYKNLRCQCVFILAEYINNHKIASEVEENKEDIIEELSNYQDVSKGDGKRMATTKEDLKMIIGRSPDISDTWQMRMYFEIKKRITEDQDEQDNTSRIQENLFIRRKANQILNNMR